MKKILGLDLGTGSIGWALVNEAENSTEQSSITRLGVRVNPLTTDEQTNFEKGKPITTCADRTLKRSMRRNLQRYKLRRENLIELLKEKKWITDSTILAEQGNGSTFETYRLRAKAATDEVTLEQLARILLMINKKRGYKSSRKAKSSDDGMLIDGMSVARQLYDEGLTPGQYGHHILSNGKHYIPDFYRSDLIAELDRIWAFQQSFHPQILTNEFRTQISRQGKTGTSKIFSAKYKIFSADTKGKGYERNRTIYTLRKEALERELTPEELALVISEVNGQANNSSGYLGAISDRSKELYFRHQTVGQHLMEKLHKNPNISLKNQPFYRQDYLDEFEQIWETQARFHPELTTELKHEIRDVVIFYQRRLKSQKWLVSNCEFENGRKVCPKSSPLYQEFRTRQMLNNITISDDSEHRLLNEDERDTLYNELQYRSKLPKAKAQKLLFNKTKGLDLNFSNLEGNRTMASLLHACSNVIEMSGHGEFDFDNMSAAESRDIIQRIFDSLGFATDWLDIDTSAKGEDLDRQPQYRLWHLLYSYEGDNSATGDEKLIEHISDLLHMPKEYAKVFASVTFEADYGNLSAKAIQKILPYLQAGHEYSEACALAGYRHSATSLTREEIADKSLLDHLPLLSKNSLRNPVVEKILNQMCHVVNGMIDQYGRPDEIRIELARELKKNASERESLSRIVSDNTKEQERIKGILQKEFGLTYVSRNDIIRYRLYMELEKNGFRTLYSNLYIPQEKLFSKEIDIEHIIPQARLFDDSFSNKTLEFRAVNIEKGNATALDYVSSKYGEQGAVEYKGRIDELLKTKAISQAKANKLKMSKADIPSDFIERDLRNTQYISRKAQEMLRSICRTVTATSGSVTDRLREDWQLLDVMQELNWDKYDKQGLTQVIEGHDGQRIRRITDWTKRNDHRHHAMDALTIAFTKPSYIQYLNNLNARSSENEKCAAIRAIEQKELYRDKNHRLRFAPPLPLDQFRVEAKRQLESVLVSIKAKNKVVTRNTNTTKSKDGTRKTTQLTPRGQLHKETVCSQMKVPVRKAITVGAKMTAEVIATVVNPAYRQALQVRLDVFDGNAKKAFSGSNSLEKKPIWLDGNHTQCVPQKVMTETFEVIYTVKKAVNKDLKIDKVVDAGIRQILQARLDAFGGDPAKAFSNLDENPIWLNQEKGLAIKTVRCKHLNNAIPLHDRHNHAGQTIHNTNGAPMPADFVDTGNNHHVAIFLDADGNLQEHIVSFYEATARAIQHLPIVDKQYRKADGWQFLFTMKQNEYFVFPAPGFDPNEVELMDEKNYALISPNLYRVQKLSSKSYVFRHHLETVVEEDNRLRNTTWKRIQNTNALVGMVKVRINHIGKIVQVGEY